MLGIKCLKRLTICLLTLFIFIYLINFWLNSKSFVFSEDVIAEIATKHAAKGNVSDPSKMFERVYKELSTEYQGHILDRSDHQWIFMNAGGWMGSMCLLHASLTEYVLFFGTALDTTGHSGRYWANVTDTILCGEFHQWPEGELTVNVHKPGETVKHVWGEVTSVHFKAGTWMVEYGRGFIPSTLGFALADTIFSTQDFLTMMYIFRVYAKALFLEISYYVGHPGEFLFYE